MALKMEISSDCYDRILAQIGADSRIYSVLKSGLLFEESGRRIVKLICEKADADIILDAARSICPEVVGNIEKTIRSFKPSS